MCHSKRDDQARRHTERKMAFLIHLAAYMAVNGGLIFLSMQTGNGDWPSYPALGWGLGLFFHGVAIATKAPEKK
jgi:hypothetical protein